MTSPARGCRKRPARVTSPDDQSGAGRGPARVALVSAASVLHHRWCSRTHVHFNKERQAGIVPRDCVSCVLALSIVASALRPAVVMRGTAFVLGQHRPARMNSQQERLAESSHTRLRIEPARCRAPASRLAESSRMPTLARGRGRSRCSRANPAPRCVAQLAGRVQAPAVTRRSTHTRLQIEPAQCRARASHSAESPRSPTIA